MRAKEHRARLATVGVSHARTVVYTITIASQVVGRQSAMFDIDVERRGVWRGERLPSTSPSTTRLRDRFTLSVRRASQLRTGSARPQG
jgi:hypothetical protein